MVGREVITSIRLLQERSSDSALCFMEPSQNLCYLIPSAWFPFVDLIGICLLVVEASSSISAASTQCFVLNVYQILSSQVKLHYIWRVNLIPYLLCSDFPLAVLSESWHSNSRVHCSLQLAVHVLMRNHFSGEFYCYPLLFSIFHAFLFHLLKTEVVLKKDLASVGGLLLCPKLERYLFVVVFVNWN